jgi:deoxyribodipyrimidine photolyase-related protein
MLCCSDNVNSASIVFPHQLYENHPALNISRDVFILEDDLFFKHFNFHKIKIAYHRATMKYYAAHLSEKKYNVHYIESSSIESNLEKLFVFFKEKSINQIYIAEVNDYLLERRLKRFANKHCSKINWCDSPNFVISKNNSDEYLKSKNKFFLTDFYIHFRKQFSILLENDKPIGGKWTFDSENRKKMPAGTIVHALPKINSSAFIKEALNYANTNFANNHGKADVLLYPITFEESKKWLNTFLNERLNNYGVYQDAMVEGESFLFHSILTPMLNVGLINPDYILDRTIEEFNKRNLPVNSVEGFVRQILGWREFIRVVYTHKGVYQRTNNHFQYTRKIPVSFYNGTTGITPIDDVINKVNEHGYAHHIERLMIVGNFMLLCEFDPDEVYRWFMELFVDAYDWVMVPNVYGMSQYADAGLMSTKPYISGSNYILKMSNYPKGHWCDVWDALYWLFIIKHKNAFAKNPRMSMMVSLANKLTEEKISTYNKSASDWFNKLGII